MSQFELNSNTPQILKQLKTSIRGYLLRGMLIVVPLGVTAYILALVYRLTAGHLVPPLRYYTGQLPEYMVALLSIVLFVLLLYLIGLAAGFVVGRRLIRLGESILEQIPVVKAIYGASRQAVDALSSEEESEAYQGAAMVQFPSVYARAIAFITGKITIEGEGAFVKLFIPTTPNPTSGYFVLYPPESMDDSPLTVEDAVKSVMSAGLISPEEPSAPESHTAPHAPMLNDSAINIKINMPLPNQAPPSASHHFFLDARKRIFNGLLVLVPIGITAFILNFIYDLTAGRIKPIAQVLVGPVPGYVTIFVSVLLLLLLLYFAGHIATAVVGKRMIKLMESFIARLPFITTVYSATKQIVKTLVDPTSGPSFQEPVFVPFPYKGVYSLGFLVGRMTTANGKEYLRIFLPTTPNVTVGLLEFYEEADVHGCNLSLEEAIKMVVSAGILGPETISFLPLAPVDSNGEMPAGALE
ncbi:MAG: DUF502 domain-containing protein [Candidatus Hydrogenedentes bacterium]|nr:DUF502 domain-containing protein [Candidatus Hydrogenedentota bacterium]